VRLSLLGALFSAAALAGPDAGLPRPAFVWDLPGVVRAAEIPEIMESDGIPVHVRAVESTWDPDSLFRHIFDSFNAAGLYVAPERKQIPAANGYLITGIDPDSFVAYTAYLQREGKRTLVVVGESWPALRKKPEAPGFAPVFPGAANLLSFRSEAGSSLTFTAPAPPKEVLAFYRDVLGKAGYAPAEDGTFAGKDGVFQITAVEQPGGSAVKVTLERRGP
jgi:hypothetical protein